MLELLGKREVPAISDACVDPLVEWRIGTREGSVDSRRWGVFGGESNYCL